MNQKIEEMSFLANVEETTRGRGVFYLNAEMGMGMMTVERLLKLCKDRKSCKSMSEIENMVTARKASVKRLKRMVKDGASAEYIQREFQKCEDAVAKKEVWLVAAAPSLAPTVSKPAKIASLEAHRARAEMEREQQREAERRELEEAEIAAFAQSLEDMLMEEEMKEMEAEMLKVSGSVGEMVMKLISSEM